MTASENDEMSEQGFPRLHLYAQDSWHDEAFVAGTRDALVALRNAIDEALDRGESSVDVYVNDGDGYRLFVQCVPEATMVNMAAPYTVGAAKEHRDDAVWPEQLVKHYDRET